MLDRVRDLIHEELRLLIAVSANDRPWQMPFAAALACALPIAVGAAFGRVDFGLISALGGLSFLYLPRTPLYHRVAWLMACAFGMIACFALGAIGHALPGSIVPGVACIAFLATMACRFFRVGPPGSLFFIMAAAIGAYMPASLLDIPLHVGLFAMGSLLACMIAFVYSAGILRVRAPLPIVPLVQPDFDFVVTDAFVIGAFVGLSLLLAQVFALERPYWAAVSCVAVIQGASLRAVWSRQFQRVIGTALGMLLAWALLSLPLGAWTVCLAIGVLCFIIETAIVRQYVFAVSFITPMTILMAEAPNLGHAIPGPTIAARFIDTLLGCAVGIAGALFLHRAMLRDAVGRVLRQAIPRRLRG